MKYNKFQINPEPNVNKNANFASLNYLKQFLTLNSPIPSHLQSPLLHPPVPAEGNFITLEEVKSLDSEAEGHISCCKLNGTIIGQQPLSLPITLKGFPILVIVSHSKL